MTSALSKFSQQRTPIYEALQAHCANEHHRFHMPGHIGGEGLPREFKDLANFDLTEIMGLDDFHLPATIIAEARQLLAEAVGANESFFLVNGASSGIQSFFLGLSNPGGEVIIPRNAHRSFYSGLVLSGAWPVYIPAKFDRDSGLNWGISLQDFISLKKDHPQAQATFLVNPNYYGIALDLDKFGGNDKLDPLIIDEAHGAHFGFHPLYPPAALSFSIAGCVQGFHKTWPVLNQGAGLHITNNYIDPERLKNALSLLTTTSPSYPILASIDCARALLYTKGEELLEKARLLALEYRARINALPGITVIGDEFELLPEVCGFDPLKLVIVLSGITLSGYQAAALLNRSHGIDFELYDQRVLLAMMSMFHGRDDWEALFQALFSLTNKYQGKRQTPIEYLLPQQPIVILSPRQAWERAKTMIALSESLGQVSGEMIAVYPPGIPCLLPGELITEPIRDYLMFLKDQKIKSHSGNDSDLENILIIEN